MCSGTQQTVERNAMSRFAVWTGNRGKGYIYPLVIELPEGSARGNNVVGAAILGLLRGCGGSADELHGVRHWDGNLHRRPHRQPTDWRQVGCISHQQRHPCMLCVSVNCNDASS